MGRQTVKLKKHTQFSGIQLNKLLEAHSWTADLEPRSLVLGRWFQSLNLRDGSWESGRTREPCLSWRCRCFRALSTTAGDFPGSLGILGIDWVSCSILLMEKKEWKYFYLIWNKTVCGFCFPWEIVNTSVVMSVWYRPALAYTSKKLIQMKKEPCHSSHSITLSCISA